MSPREAAVADAGPLIHLDELSSLSILECYQRVWVPVRVAEEASKYRTGWQARGPGSLEIVEVRKEDVAFLRKQLTTIVDPGELEALAF